jgi:hypothetical protein
METPTGSGVCAFISSLLPPYSSPFRTWKLAMALGVALIATIPTFAQRVVVFPLKQEAGPPSSEWIGTGLAVALDEALSRGGVPNIPVDDLHELYDQEGLVRAPGFSLPSLVGLARQMGAGVLVEGGFKAEDSRVVARLSAYDLAGDVHRLGSWEESASLSELPDLTRRLGEEIFAVLNHPWVAAPAVSPQAFESYIRGRIADDPTLQEVYFRKALEIQPDYLDAQCQLALVLKETGRVTEAASLLVGLEGKSYPKAYLGLVALAGIRMEQGRITEAQPLLMKSLKAAESPEAHIALAQWYLKQKKLREATMELVMAEKFGTHQDDIDALRRQIEREQGQTGSGSAPSPPAAPAPDSRPAPPPTALEAPPAAGTTPPPAP